MEPPVHTLRRLLGRSEFGFYAVGEDGSSPILLSSSADWPTAGADPTGLIKATRLMPGLSDGRLHRLADLRLAGGRDRLPRDLALLALGTTERLRGLLLLRAGQRSAIWRCPAHEWALVVGFLEAVLQGEELLRELTPLRDFHDVLLASLPLGVLCLDHRGRVTYISPPAEQILGFDAEGAVGTHYTSVLRPAGVEEDPLQLGLRGKISRVELYIIDREGKEKPVWLQMSRIRGRGGHRTRRLLVLIRDTSEERAFEDEMRRRERLASIGELSAGVAHEIRNPLTGIANCAQVLRDRILPDDPRQRFVQIILDEAARLNRIVESLLSFARPGRPQLRESDVVETLTRIVELEREQIAERGITTDIKVRGRIPKIYIDPEQIAQVLLNVVRNATQAMPSGGRLSLECSVIRRRPHLRRGTGQRKTDRIRLAGEGPMVRFVQIRISDSGGGIPKDVLPRIFDPFFTTRPKGTGLGLSISQSIVKEHRGFISVRSIENKGTSVSIDLPLERRHSERRKPSR